MRQHHHRVALTGQVRQQLGMPFEEMPGQMQRLLGQRRGDDGVRLTRLHHLGGFFNRTIRPLATDGGDLSRHDFTVDRTDVDHGERQIVDAHVQLDTRLVQGKRTAEHEQFDAPFPDFIFQIARRLDDDFRTDTGRVAHGDRQTNGF